MSNWSLDEGFGILRANVVLSASGQGGLQEDEWALYKDLQQSDLLDLLAAAAGVEGAQVTVTGSAEDPRKAAATKRTRLEGAALDPSGKEIGYCCRKGSKRPPCPNQDAWCVLRAHGVFSIYGVFDGHGTSGHDISNAVKDLLPKIILSDKRFLTPDMPQALRDAFVTSQRLVLASDSMRKLSARFSGTTATLVVHDHVSRRLTIAHVADSSACVGCASPESGKAPQVRFLTREHRPDLPEEQARIEKFGGVVEWDGSCNHRVYAPGSRYPGLNMSRCIGDLVGHQECGVVAEPDITELELTADDRTLVVCSDGVWEFISAPEALAMVDAQRQSSPMDAVSSLAQEAWERWIEEENGTVDDITVVLVNLEQCGDGVPDI